MTETHQHSDLSRFAQEFRDEAHLRLVLNDLLLRMGAKGVRITHGINERGKDIIFYKPGGLSRDVLYACVVKKDKITGRADSATGARTVLNQAGQALSEPYTNPATGKEEKVHSVYVISPYECTVEAVESIKHELREQARRIEFICGIDLLALFQEHWPDFLRFESAVLTRYLSTLSAGLSVDSALVSLLTRHNANLGLKPFETFYVPNELEIRLDSIEALQKPLPWETAFDQYLTWEELQDTISRLRFWRTVFRSPELTGEESTRLQNLSRFVDEFSKTAKRYWEQALKTKRQRKITEDDKDRSADHRKAREQKTPKRERKTLDVEERLVDVPADVKSRYLECLTVFNRVNQDLIKIQRASVAASRAGARSPEEPSRLLIDEDFRFMSIAYDYFNALPRLIKQKNQLRLALNPESLFENCRAILISGPPGSGKTSFCRWQTLQAIDRFSTDWAQPLPVYVPAHKFAGSGLRGFEEIFLGGIDVMELWPREDQKINVPIRLFVDGLDELPDREQQRALIEALKEGLQKYPRLVAVVTSRPYVWGRWLNWLPRIHISELKSTEQQILAEKWLDDPTQVSAFFAQLTNSPALRRLMGTPLLATLILNLYRKTPAIPENKASLYRAFVDLYCGGWDVAKGLHKAGRFGNEQKLRPLPGLAYRMHLSHRADCSEAMFANAVRDTIPALAERANDLLAEVIQDGILVRTGEDLLFAHLSFQEYLAAQYLASDPSGNRPALALRSFLKGEDWWKEVVEFYVISRDDPATVDDWIRRTSRGVGQRRREDAHDEHANDIIARLDGLAIAMAETFPGYIPRFNQPNAAEGRTRARL